MLGATCMTHLSLCYTLTLKLWTMWGCCILQYLSSPHPYPPTGSSVVQTAHDMPWHPHSLRPCGCTPWMTRDNFLGLAHAQVLLQSGKTAKAHTWEELSHRERDSLAPRCCWTTHVVTLTTFQNGPQPFYTINVTVFHWFFHVSTYKLVAVKSVGKSSQLLWPVRHIRRKISIPSVSSIYEATSPFA